MFRYFHWTILLASVSFLVTQTARADKPEGKNTARMDLNDEALPKGAIARLGTLRFRHADPVTAMVFAPDGKALFSASGGEGSRDNTIRLWTWPDGREIRRFVGHRNGILCMALSPDGKRLASAGIGGIVRIWDVATGQQVISFSAGHHRVLTIAFAPDGRTLASAGFDHLIHLWDLKTEKEFRTFAGHSRDVHTILFTPDGKNLISGGGDHTVRLWDVALGQELRQFGQERQAKGQATALSPNGKVVVSADGEVYRWELATGRQLGDRLGGLLRTDVSGQFLAFSPDGRKLAVQGWSGWIFLWDLEKDQEIHKLRGPYGIYNNLAFSPDGKVLAAGGYGNTIRFWETATGKELAAGRNPQGPVYWLSFARGDKSLVAAGNDSARIWDLGDAKEPLNASRRYGEPLTQGTAYIVSPDGRTLAVSQEKIRFVDLATGEVEGRSPQDPQGRCIGFMPNGRHLFLIHREGRTVILWSRVAGREIRRFVGHLAAIRGSAVSPDGRYLATTSATSGFAGRRPPADDDSIRLWDVATGRERWRLPIGGMTLTFSGDGALLAGLDRSYAIHVWETETGKEVLQFQEPHSYINQLAFSPDGKTLACATRDGKVQLREVVTGKEQGQFAGHRGDVLALAFSVDGRRLASGGNDTSVLLWDLTTSNESKASATGDKAQDFTSSWRDLGSSDAALAYHALWQLAGAENKAVAFIKTQFRPVQPIKEEIISGWIKDLDSNQFSVREQAALALANAAELAELALQQALDEKPTLETRRRIERLLAGSPANQPSDRLRGLRAIKALTEIGTPEARALLKELSGGVAQARITREAQAALDRLERREAAPPWSPPSYQPTADGERVLQTTQPTLRDPYGGVLPPRAVARLGPIDPDKKTLLTGLSFSPDGKWLMVGDGSSAVRLWKRGQGKPFREFRVESGALDEATLSADGKLLAAATRQGSRELIWCLWDVASGREIRRTPVASAVSAICFSPDSKQIVIGNDDRKGRLLDVSTGKELSTFEGAGESFGRPIISPDGKLLVMSERAAVWIWELATGRLVRRLGNTGGSLSFSPDGQLLAIGGNGYFFFLDVATGKAVFQVEQPNMGGVFASAFSPDGRTLATSSWDGQVRLWELATGQIRTTFKGHTDRLFCVAFSRDGREVASGGVEGSVLVWDGTGQSDKDRPGLALSELTDLWHLLAYGKSEKAYQAEWRLAAAGQPAVEFMEKNLQPVPKDWGSPLQKAVAGLEENRSEQRDAAMNELDCYGSLVELSLRKALSDPHSSEARARIEYLLEKQQSHFPSGALLRSLRAIEVLEWIGTPQARGLLEKIAAGNPQARLTREAKASLERVTATAKELRKHDNTK
jgi:WD40 repeat protein